MTASQDTLSSFGDVDKALEEFYESAVHDAAQETNITEKEIREWCEYQLITSSETRDIVHQSGNYTAGMSNKVVEILDKKYYLIRPEPRSGGVWYELTHDRLIKPIKNFNMKWREKEGKRKSRRNRLIIIPSGIAVAAAVAITLVVLFGPHPLPPVPHMINICSMHSLANTGVHPVYAAVNPKTNTTYVANQGSNTVSVINCSGFSGKTDLVVKTINLGSFPDAVAVNPNTNIIYVTNYNDNTVSVIDGKTNSVVKTIQVENSPVGVAINPNTNMVYTTNRRDNTVSVIYGRTNSVVNTIEVGKNPYDLTINPNTNRIYVTNQGHGTVSIIKG